MFQVLRIGEKSPAAQEGEYCVVFSDLHHIVVWCRGVLNLPLHGNTDVATKGMGQGVGILQRVWGVRGGVVAC